MNSNKLQAKRKRKGDDCVGGRNCREEGVLVCGAELFCFVCGFVCAVIRLGVSGQLWFAMAS